VTSSSPPDPLDQRHQALAGFAARSREAARRDGLDAAAAEAITALGKAGVEVLLLKGAGLAQTLYAPDLERSYYDIDLLAAPRGRSTAAQVLTALGYRNITASHGIEDIGGVIHAELWTRLDPSGNVSIDLHSKLAGCGASDGAFWRSLRAAAQPIEIGGRPVLTLGTPGLAMHVALHLAQHGPDDIKAASDLRFGLTRWPEPVWRAAAELAAELEAAEAFSAGMRLIPEGEPMADSLGLASGEAVLWDLNHRDARPRGTFRLEALAHAIGVRERVTIVRRSLLPSPDWIRWEMRWASRSRAHLAAAYLRHMARAPVWAARALVFNRHRQH